MNLRAQTRGFKMQTEKTKSEAAQDPAVGFSRETDQRTFRRILCSLPKEHDFWKERNWRNSTSGRGTLPHQIQGARKQPCSAQQAADQNNLDTRRCYNNMGKQSKLMKPENKWKEQKWIRPSGVEMIWNLWRERDENPVQSESAIGT